MGTEFEVVVRPMGDGVSRGPAFPKRCANFGDERKKAGAEVAAGFVEEVERGGVGAVDVDAGEADHEADK